MQKRAVLRTYVFAFLAFFSTALLRQSGIVHAVRISKKAVSRVLIFFFFSFFSFFFSFEMFWFCIKNTKRNSEKVSSF